jgi:hypothetical protein
MTYRLQPDAEAVMHMRRRFLFLGLGGMTFAPVAIAQTAPTVRLRATIEAVSASDITVVTRGSVRVTLKLAHAVSVAWVVPTPLDSIQPHSFIGVTAVPGDNGTLKALEVHVFPEAMRGTGEGHRPWDLAPGSTMTNGTVGSVLVAKGRLLTVGYNGGEQKIFVPEETPVVTYQPADTNALTTGAHVILFATEDSDGTRTAVRISVGKDSLIPPM